MDGFDFMAQTLGLAALGCLFVVVLGALLLARRAAPLLTSPGQRSREAAFLAMHTAAASAAVVVMAKAA